MTKTFAERCHIAQQFLPDAQYKALLTNLHAEMLAALADQPAPVVPVQQETSDLKHLAAICPELNMSNYTSDDVDELNHWVIEVATAIVELAEQPAPAAQQEPVAWMQDSIELYVQDRPGASYTIPLYTTPQAQPAREPLTWEQRVKIVSNAQRNELDEYDLIEDVEAAHGIKEKNT